jgi:DNA repair protein RadD
MQLRPYQNTLLDETRGHMLRGIKKILIQSPTGSGKTILTASMLMTAASKGMDSFFVVHRRELVKQSCLTFDKVGLSHGIIAAGFAPDINRKVQICSIDSLRSRLSKLNKRPKLIVWDEAHHLASASWAKIFNEFNDAYHILLTATPERLDGKGLKNYADVLLNGPSVRWLIENGYLADYVAYAPNQISMAGIKKQMGDYSKSESAALIDKPSITGSAVKEYMKVGYGKRFIGFAITIEHSHHIVEEYKAAGIPAAHLDGESPSNYRDQVLKDLASGELKYVSNVGLFSEGFDLPSLDGLQMLRPTASLSMYLQMCGRPLRPDGDKVAIILDHVGNIERHGLPCDERKWSLDGKAGRSKNGERVTPVKICKKCYATQPSGNGLCAYCGAVFEIKEREIEQIDGELSKVDKEKMKLAAKKERQTAGTYEDLVKLGYARGYKSPEKWAMIIHKSREAKKQGKR